MWVNVQAPYETSAGNGVHFTAEAFRLNRGKLVGGDMWYPYKVPDGTYWIFRAAADLDSSYVEITDSTFTGLVFPATTAQTTSGGAMGTGVHTFNPSELTGLANAQSPIDGKTDGSHWIALDSIPTAAQAGSILYQNPISYQNQIKTKLRICESGARDPPHPSRLCYLSPVPCRPLRMRTLRTSSPPRAFSPQSAPGPSAVPLVIKRFCQKCFFLRDEPVPTQES